MTPIPPAEVAQVGPASVTVDAPIRAGPGPSFDLIFTVPRGSTLQQTGNVVDPLTDPAAIELRNRRTR